MKCPKCGKELIELGELGQLSPYNESSYSWGCKKCRFIRTETQAYIDKGEEWFDGCFEEG